MCQVDAFDTCLTRPRKGMQYYSMVLYNQVSHWLYFNLWNPSITCVKQYYEWLEVSWMVISIFSIFCLERLHHVHKAGKIYIRNLVGCQWRQGNTRQYIVHFTNLKQNNLLEIQHNYVILKDQLFCQPIRRTIRRFSRGRMNPNC